MYEALSGPHFSCSIIKHMYDSILQTSFLTTTQATSN